ncbi:MAG: cryptochrome/photolyase family protein [Sandaracinaceae bacterium]
MAKPGDRPRTLAIVLGDQLDHGSAVFDDLDPTKDAIWMAEVEAETRGAHRRRIALFLAAMRHRRAELEAEGWRVHYHALGPDPAEDRGRTFAEVLEADAERLRPERLRVVQPGDHRVLLELRSAADALGVDLEVAPDRHFICALSDFEAWAEGRKSLVLEHFYRHLRKREGILLTDEGEPVGGQWNFDEANRESFGADGPPPIPAPRAFAPDDVTQEVLDLVERRFADSPGRLDGFDLAVTREQAQAALDDFIESRLPRFGTFQDAMWDEEPFLYHARLSYLLNLKLLDPRDCVARAVQAHADDAAPLAAVEGFVRQILGWRELVRGIYWRMMPGYAERNALDCDEDADVPAFYWTGDTDLECVRAAMTNVLDHGYAHHIQRLMVLGLFAQLLGVHPYRFHRWHMALYLDAIDWVSLPNARGMSQDGDGGVIGTKPYCASGAYIHRMSNHCRTCRYRPKAATGDDACPFTTLYWDFLARHRERLSSNRRMGLQLRNVDRKKPAELEAIRARAASLRERYVERRSGAEPSP